MPPKKKVKVGVKKRKSPPHLTIKAAKKYSADVVNELLAKHGIEKIKIENPTWFEIKSHCEMRRVSISQY